MKTKYRFKLHSILGIVSILLLSCKNFFLYSIFRILYFFRIFL
ncbi:putative lipoprotein [Leptospira interrogans serovar Australis str. 200703203]|uniref:Putative lipoprotein n=1 Tax=Leptospira interrogans serovar Australis str. 200703203 TaxID=1085541 RepID=N1ULL4_LEPIR|nr:putative lipoprotein [Leptospira interrogans serovar Bulgarica str. Mallika]EMY25752.1 putative lipoprotein [Leptospira interrogans serovar Australis str. 200703203]